VEFDSIYRFSENSDIHLYIRADEPVYVRRQQVFDHLKRKAENEGKTVMAENDALSVNGVLIFSIQSG